MRQPIHLLRFRKNAVTVIIPTLNEESGIGKVIDEVKAEGFTEILVVDGRSTDSTARIAEYHGADVVMQHDVGKSGALKTAIDMVQTPYMAVLDGDYTYDPKDLSELLNYAEDYDLVIGYRSDRSNISGMHRVGNGLITFAFNTLLGAGLADVLSGMYVLSAEAARKLEITSRGFDVEVEIAAQCATYGRVAQVPIGYRQRLGTQKLRSVHAGFFILLSTLRLARRYNPVFLFGALASVLAVPGALIALWQLWIRFLYGASSWSVGLMWAGLILLLIGLQGFGIATIALMLKRIEKRLLNTMRPA